MRQYAWSRVLRDSRGGAAEKGPERCNGRGDQDDPHFRNAPDHERCDFVRGICGGAQSVELHGFDETADGGEDSQAHKETEGYFEFELDLETVDEDDGVEGEEEIGCGAPGCFVPSSATYFCGFQLDCATHLP